MKIPRINKYTYPDVVVACSEEQFEDEQRDTLLNPRIIFEILSDTTEAYDRGKKFEHYQSLESLREYLLISQDSSRIEQYVRQDDRTWTYSEFHRADDTVHLPTIDCNLTLQDVYVKVT
jgi:Uma2 family endonuclease